MDETPHDQGEKLPSRDLAQRLRIDSEELCAPPTQNSPNDSERSSHGSRSAAGDLERSNPMEMDAFPNEVKQAEKVSD